MPTRAPSFPHLLAILAIALAGAGCGETKAVTIDPEISLTGGGGEKLTSLDFGKVPVEQTASLDFTIQSLRPVALEVSSIRIEARDQVSAAFFSVEEADGFQVPGSSFKKIAVRFQPADEGVYNATLIVSSSDPKKPESRISLTGEGIAGAMLVSACLPDDETDRSRCSRTRVEAPHPLVIGGVVAGQVQGINVTVSNLGYDALSIGKVRFADEEEAAAFGFTLSDRAREGVTVDPLGNQSFSKGSLVFQPPLDLEGAANAVLVIESNDRNQPEIELPLQATVIPNLPPRACLIATEVRKGGGAPEQVQQGVPLIVSPTDVVIFESAVREGCSGDPEGGAITREWSITGPDEFAKLEDEFGKPTQKSFKAQVIGEDFAADLKVTDEFGLSATTDEHGVPAHVPFTVKPMQDVAVEVRWPEHPGVDLDLHLVRSLPPATAASGLFTRKDDCYSLNPNPDWGSDSARSSPKLAIDDTGSTEGMVETVLLNLPEEQHVYSIYVHLYKDDRVSLINAAPACSSQATCAGNTRCIRGKCLPRVEVSARVFVRGEEKLSSSFSLDSPCETWEVGKITWPATPQGAIVVERADRLSVEGTAVGAQCDAPVLN